MKGICLGRAVGLGVRPLLTALCLPALVWTSSQLAAGADDTPAGRPRERAELEEAAKQERLVSLVLLLSGPRKLDEHALATTISKAVGIPHRHDESADTFVVAKAPYYLIKLQSGPFVVNNIAEPYFKDDNAAEGVEDPKLGRAIRAHRAWISIDWVQSGQSADLRSVYQGIGKIAAALAGSDTLAVYNPDTDSINLYDEALAGSLRGEDPLERFASPGGPQVVSIKDDDPRLKAAEAEAKRRWPEFVNAFQGKRGEGFAVKGRLVEGQKAEYMWLSVTDVRGQRVHGTLANQPADLKGFALGQDLHIEVEDVDDWLYLGPDRQPKGGFTLRVIEEASKRPGSQ